MVTIVIYKHFSQQAHKIVSFGLIKKVVDPVSHRSSLVYVLTTFIVTNTMVMEARSGQNCNNKIAPQVSFFSHCCTFN